MVPRNHPFLQKLKILHSVTLNAYILTFIKRCRSIEPLLESIFIVEPHRQEIHTVLLEEFSEIGLNLKKYAISMWRL